MKFLALLLMLPGICTLAAQEPVGLTFDEALERMLACHLALKAEAKAEQAALEEEHSTRGLWMPSITLKSGYLLLDKDVALNLNSGKTALQNWIGALGTELPESALPALDRLTTPLLQGDWRLGLQARKLATVGGEITLPLWMGGRIRTARRAARIEVENSRRETEILRNRLIIQLVERYYGVVLAQHAVEVRRQISEAVKRHLRDAEALERNGVIASAERLYVAVKWEEAQRELKNSELQLKTLHRSLTNLLSEEDLPPLISSLFLLDSLPEESLFQSRALKQNPQLLLIEQKQQLANEGLLLRKAELLPEVVALGSFSLYNYQVNDLVPRWAVGVGLNWKLFAGGSKRHRYKAAQATAEEAALWSQETEQQVMLAVENNYNELQHYANRVAAAEASQALCKLYLKNRRIAFHEGVCTASQLIDAEVELASVTLQRLQASYEYLVRLARLLESTGQSTLFPSYLHSSATHLLESAREEYFGSTQKQTEHEK